MINLILCNSLQQERLDRYITRIKIENRQDYYKFILTGRRTSISKIIFKKQNKVRKIGPSNFKKHYIATAIKCVGFQKNSEIDPHKYAQVTLTKYKKKTQWRQDSVLSELF